MKQSYENLKEEFWNGINELKKAQDRLTESQEATDKQMKSTDERLSKLTESQEATDKQMKETDKQIKETSEQMKETDKQIKETSEQMKETDKQIKETSEQMKETDEMVGELTKNIKEANGNFNNKWGEYLEKLVRGGLVKILKKRGIKVERIWPRMILKGKKKGITEGEIDIVAVNGNELVAVEVKTDLRKDYVERFLKRIKRLKKCWPEFKDKTVYGGMAFLTCYNPEALDALEENGLFIIRAVGGNMDISIIDNPEDFKPKEY